jgi:hypothetical protein
MAMDPSGKFAYVASLHDNNVWRYTINSATGALTPVSGSPCPVGGIGPSFLIASKIGSGTPRRALARFPRLRGERDLRPANLSKLAVVAERILVPAQDGTHDERIVGVADLRNRIWDYVYFLGRITKGKRSFLS